MNRNAIEKQFNLLWYSKISFVGKVNISQNRGQIFCTQQTLLKYGISKFQSHSGNHFALEMKIGR